MAGEWIVLWRVVLWWIVLWWIVLWRIVLWRIVLGRIVLGRAVFGRIVRRGVFSWGSAWVGLVVGHVAGLPFGLDRWI